MKLFDGIYNIRIIDSLSEKESIIHKIAPEVKLIVTLIYVITIVSFKKYEISGILVFILYPVSILILGELEAKPIIKTILLAQLFIVGFGMINLFFDREIIKIGEIYVISGVVALISMLLKGILTVSSLIMLVATTSIYDISLALSKLKVPRIFILQILLLYRYIFLLSEEAMKMTNAYEMRAPEKKGIEFREWGSFLGTLLLRAYDRGEQVYRAMELRGFKGEYILKKKEKLKCKDYAYGGMWIAFFLTFRLFNISLFLERMIS